ncbi:MAG: hypothetical protein V1701_02870 [Planctomycetota bacterium]
MKQEPSQKQIDFINKFGGKYIRGNIVFSGNLDCSNNQLKELPQGLKVSGWLNCSNNQLKELPQGLKVSGNLYCYSNQLKELPQGLKVSGGLDCYNNQLKELPQGLKVSGNLYCYSNQLKELPQGLKVTGGLYPFPDRISFADNISLANAILKGTLTANEVFALANKEHQRIVYRLMDKKKIDALPGIQETDKQIDGQGNPMSIISFTKDGFDKPFRFLKCVCPTKGEIYLIERVNDTDAKLAKTRSFGLPDGVEFTKEV